MSTKTLLEKANVLQRHCCMTSRIIWQLACCHGVLDRDCKWCKLGLQILCKIDMMSSCFKVKDTNSFWWNKVIWNENVKIDAECGNPYTLCLLGYIVQNPSQFSCEFWIMLWQPLNAFGCTISNTFLIHTLTTCFVLGYIINILMQIGKQS